MIEASTTTSNTSGDSDWKQIIIDDTSQLVELQTWRDGSPEKEKRVQDNLDKIKDFFTTKMNNYNDQHAKQVPMQSFEWRSDPPKYRVFGFRAGKGPRKVSIICHLDTVPPGNDDWHPFKPRVETRVYNGVPTDFLIGRGSIDDKGPAVVAFEAFTRALNSANETALDS
jgi:succinyl-diaminopimelate desuccinylase